MLFRISTLSLAIVSLVMVDSANAVVSSTYTLGTPGNLTDATSVFASEISSGDFVNGATDGGPANGNGVSLALSIPGDFGSDGGVGDGIYQNGLFANNTGPGWALFQGGAETATYTFATPVSFYGGRIDIYASHFASGGDMDVLVEVNTGSGFTTLVDAGLGGQANGESRLSIGSIFNGSVTQLRLTFDLTTVVGEFTLIREIDVFTTPEPSTGLLAAFGMTGLVMRRRTRSKRG